MKKALILAIALLPSGALAEEKENKPGLLTPFGMGMYAGGGVGGFTDEGMRDLTGTAGVWEARMQIGTRLPVSFEAAYVGTAQAIDALGLDTDAVLLGSGVEGRVRVNLISGEVQPYLFAGAGWTRYDLTNIASNTSSVEGEDDVLAVPLGAGISYRYRSFLGDLRGTYRPVVYEDLVPMADDAGHEELDNWGVALHAGFEF